MYLTHNSLEKFDFKKLQKQTTKILHTKGGTILMAAGAVATLVPVVGLIAGPIISAGGAQLDKAQKAKLAKKLVQKKEPELTKAKEDLESGKLTNKEYEDKVEGTLEQSAKEVREETIKKIQTKDNSKIMIGGAVVLALLIARK